MVKQFGADTLRLYIAFAASYHDSFSWDTKSIVGPRRFIERVWAMQYKVSKEKNTNEEAETVLHQTIKKVGEDYERLSFNTAVAQLMIFVNVIEKLEKVNIEDYKILLKLLAPICPFFTEEIWKNLGEKKSIHLSTWPKFDQKKTINKNITFAIQINGKVRGEFEGVVDMKDEDVVKLCKETETYKKWITEAGVIEPRKIIVVKNKLVNVVV
jgi:leucyl-tRNA synthetase